MFKQPSYIKNKLRSLCFKLFNLIENNGNCDFSNNGEQFFLNQLFKKYATTKDKQFVIFDVGANIGNYAKIVAQIAKVHAVEIELHLFEPTKSCFTALESTFAKRLNIKLNNFGLSDKDGSGKIYYDSEKSALASIYQRNLKAYNLSLDSSETIELKTLAGYILQHKISHLDYLKIDIEGHELSALKGMASYLRPDFVDFIQFEYGGANLDSRTSLLDLYDIFESAGFAIAKIMPNGLQPRSYQAFMENFMYANYVAYNPEIKI